MRDHLQAVISQLYRPPADRRQVFALSRRDAERIPVLPSVALISITAPERGPAQLGEFEHLLRLSFADVDTTAEDLSRRAKAKLADAFQPAQAREIIEFVDALPPSIQTVVVHCEGGFSRSCAVAKFLQDRRGYVAEPERLTEANPTVYKALTATGQTSVSRRTGRRG